MDNFSKQAKAQAKYDTMRRTPQEEYKGNYESPHYKEVTNNAVKPDTVDIKEEFNSKYKEDFDKASKDFWQRETQTGLAKYNGGSLTAKFGKDVYTLEELLERIGKFIKESITNELMEKKLSTEELAENFTAIEVALKLLAKAVEKVDNKVDVQNISAYLHGFINTYIETMIRKKLERDKGSTQNG